MVIINCAISKRVAKVAILAEIKTIFNGRDDLSKVIFSYLFCQMLDLAEGDGINN